MAGEKTVIVLNPEFILVNPGSPLKDAEGHPQVEEKTGVEIWEVEPVWKTDFKAVPVFDISQTEGVSAADPLPYVSVTDAVIREKMHITVIEAEAGELPAYQTYLYEEDKKILNIKKGFTEKERDHEALKFLVNDRAVNAFKVVPGNVNALINFTHYIFENILSMQSKNIIRGLAGQMENLTHDEKKGVPG